MHPLLHLQRPQHPDHGDTAKNQALKDRRVTKPPPPDPNESEDNDQRHQQRQIVNQFDEKHGKLSFTSNRYPMAGRHGFRRVSDAG